MSDAAHAHTHDHDHGHHHPTGLMRWVKTTNHKDIGTLYLLFALIMLFTAGSMALLIRAELFQPGLQLTNPDFFNQLTTMHGLIMIFWRDHAGVLRLCELAGAAHDRRARHGFPAHEQLGVLDFAGGGIFPDRLVLPAGWRGGGWLDDVSAAVHSGRHIL